MALLPRRLEPWTPPVHFTGRIESRDDFAENIDHLGLGIDPDAAHAMMNSRPLGNGVEGPLDHGDHDLGYGLVEIGIFAVLDIFVVFVDRLDQGIGRNVDFSGQFRDGVRLDETSLGKTRRNFLIGAAHLQNHGIAENRIGRFRVCAQVDLGKGADIAAFQFIDKTLSLFGDIDDTVTGTIEGINGRCIEDARFRFGKGIELDKIHLQGIGADSLGKADRFAGGARLVRAVE